MRLSSHFLSFEAGLWGNKCTVHRIIWVKDGISRFWCWLINSHQLSLLSLHLKTSHCLEEEVKERQAPWILLILKDLKNLLIVVSRGRHLLYRRGDFLGFRTSLLRLMAVGRVDRNLQLSSGKHGWDLEQSVKQQIVLLKFKLATSAVVAGSTRGVGSYLYKWGVQEELNDVQEGRRNSMNEALFKQNYHLKFQIQIFSTATKKEEAFQKQKD